MQDRDFAGAHPPLDRVWLIGCGAMGGALLARWLEAGMAASRVVVIDPAPRALPGGYSGLVVADAAAAAAACPDPTALVLAVKPQRMMETAIETLPHAPGPLMLISMLAGVRTGSLQQLFPEARVIRIMPNTPARIGKGVTALFGNNLAPGDADAADALLAPAGNLLWLDDEQKFDAVTALSGSGPAFLFRFIEALAGAGEAAGLEKTVANQLAHDTVCGAAALAAQSADSVAALRQQVTSPNGTTEAGLDVLDGDGALSSLLRATVRAAAERSRALAAAAELAADSGREPLRVDALGGDRR